MFVSELKLSRNVCGVFISGRTCDCKSNKTDLWSTADIIYQYELRRVQKWIAGLVLMVICL